MKKIFSWSPKVALVNKIRVYLCVAVLLMSCAPIQITFSEEEYLVIVYEDLKDSKAQLYLKANDWMVKTFTNAESVIQHADKEEGVIIGKYLMFGEVKSNAYVSLDSRVYAVIDLRVRDQKARIEIKPQGTWNYQEGTIYGLSKEAAKLEMEELAKSFHEAMLKKGVEF